MNIQGIGVTPVQPLAPPSAKPDVQSKDFTQLLQSAMSRVEGSARDASQQVEQLLTGETQDLHSVALSAQKASLEFEMLLQVRNKIVQAYQEVMRMQL